MKKILLTILTIVVSALIIQSCKKDSLTQNETTHTVSERTVKVGTLTTIMPEGYDPEILNYSQEDWNHKIKSLAIAKQDILTIGILDNLTQPLIDNYPDVDNLTPENIAEISSDFGGISQTVIENNSEVIQNYYSTLITSDLVDLLQDNGKYGIGGVQIVFNPNTGDPIIDLPLNGTELALLASHPLTIKGIKTAGTKAVDLSEIYYNNPFYNTTLNATQYPILTDYWNKKDAFRHTLWNYLMCKYTVNKFINTANCVIFIKAFADAHELNPSGAATDILKLTDHAMDLHNNHIGRQLFVNSVVNTGGLFTTFTCPDEGTMSNKVWWDMLYWHGVLCVTPNQVDAVDKMEHVFMQYN